MTTKTSSTHSLNMLKRRSKHKLHNRNRYLSKSPTNSWTLLPIMTMRLQNNLEVVEESGGKWVDVVKKMGKQMDNFVSQGEARERATCSCNARIIRFDETEGETTQQLFD